LGTAVAGWDAAVSGFGAAGAGPSGFAAAVAVVSGFDGTVAVASGFGLAAGGAGAGVAGATAGAGWALSATTNSMPRSIGRRRLFVVASTGPYVVNSLRSSAFRSSIFLAAIRSSSGTAAGAGERVEKNMVKKYVR